MKALENIKYALLENNEVSYIFTKEDMPAWDEKTLFVVPLKENEHVELGYIYDSFTQSFVAPSLETYKEKKLEYIFMRFERELAFLRGDKTQAETNTWEAQLNEAQALLLDSNAYTPFLSHIAQERNMDKRELASKVIENNASFKEQYAKLLAYQQTIRKQIQNATTKEELDKIAYISPFHTN